MIGNKNMVVRVRALCARIHLRPNYFVCVWYAIQIQHGSERGRGRKDGRAECSYRSPISRPIHHNQNVDSSNCELRSSSLPSSELCTLYFAPPAISNLVFCISHLPDDRHFLGLPACQLHGNCECELRLRNKHGTEITFECLKYSTRRGMGML